MIKENITTSKGNKVKNYNISMVKNTAEKLWLGNKHILIWNRQKMKVVNGLKMGQKLNGQNAMPCVLRVNFVR